MTALRAFGLPVMPGGRLGCKRGGGPLLCGHGASKRYILYMDLNRVIFIAGHTVCVAGGREIV